METGLHLGEGLRADASCVSVDERLQLLKSNAFGCVCTQLWSWLLPSIPRAPRRQSRLDGAGDHALHPPQDFRFRLRSDDAIDFAAIPEDQQSGNALNSKAV